MAFHAFVCIFLLVCLHTHIAQAHSVNNFPTTLKFLNQLGGVKKGDNVEGVYELKNYLSYLGYLNYNGHSKDENEEHNNIFDDSLEMALNRYQESHDLNITGILDTNTITKMHQPKRGMLDFSNPSFPFHTESHYSFFEGKPKWKKNNLSYTFLPNVFKEAQQPLTNALNEWASKTHFKFHYVRNMNQADIKLTFVRWDNVGNNDELARSLRPPGGLIQFYANRNWSWVVPKRDFYDMQTVALHELGHVLGLDHSTNVKALMYPMIRPGVRKRIHRDDIEGIKALYMVK